MDSAKKHGGNIIGALFLGVGLWNFLRGENWVVWVILGVLFGGIAFITSRISSK